jgi:hypothetical protein
VLLIPQNEMIQFSSAIEKMQKIRDVKPNPKHDTLDNNPLLQNSTDDVKTLSPLPPIHFQTTSTETPPISYEGNEKIDIMKMSDEELISLRTQQLQNGNWLHFLLNPE